MPYLRSCLLATLCCCAMATQLPAQEYGPTSAFRSSALTNDYYEYYRQEGESSPSDIAVVPPAADEDAQVQSSQPSCSDHWGSVDCEDAPWRLFPELDRGWSLTGWINAGGTAGADSPASRRLGPLAFNDRQEVQANQIYAVLERPIDTNCSDWDIGGRVDLLYGTDGRFLQVPGLELRRDGSRHWNSRTFYQLAMPQLYASFAYRDLSVKVGHWYNCIGYECIPAPSNFFYSHAYSMLYARPFTHTGAVATWKRSDQLSLIGGFHNGWNSFDATTNRAALLSGFNWHSCDERLAIAMTMTTGDEINNQNAYSERSLYSLVVDYRLSDRLNYVIQHDHGWQENDGGANVDAEWYGINQYVFYTLNDCWAAGTRVEWFRDDDGVRVPDFAGNTGFAGNFYGVTSGLRWTPCSNLTVRPEVRWDWYDGVGLPFDDGAKDDQFSAAVDAILLF